MKARLALLAFATTAVLAQEPVRVTVASPALSLAPGAAATVRLALAIAPPYHIYSPLPQLDARGAGPIPTTITVKPAGVLALAGPLGTSAPKKHFDAGFQMDVLTLEGRAWIDVPLKAAATVPPGVVKAALILGYQACDEQSCLPPAEVEIPLNLTVGAAAPAAAASTPDAEQAYQTIRVRRIERPPPGDVQTTSAFQRKQHDEVSRAAEKYLREFPHDAHHWEVVAWAVNSPRLADLSDGPPDPAWNKKRDELRDELLAGKDVPDALWVSVAERYADDLDGFRGAPVRDLAKAGRIVEMLAARVPASPRRKFVEQTYVDALMKAEPAAAEALLRRRVAEAETNQAVKEMAAGCLRIVEMRRTPLELKFTAADGREVDLAKLRGKVVLVDFWATWCGPCLKEMPNVRAAYKKYNARGFEVIGISFDKAPGATPRPMEKTAAEVSEFAQKNDMPWPHHYDGKYWDNEFGRRFAIHEIPATFLLDQTGRLVTTETHGEALEREVKRLLKL